MRSSHASCWFPSLGTGHISVCEDCNWGTCAVFCRVGALPQWGWRFGSLGLWEPLWGCWDIANACSAPPWDGAGSLIGPLFFSSFTDTCCGAAPTCQCGALASCQHQCLRLALVLLAPQDSGKRSSFETVTFQDLGHATQYGSPALGWLESQVNLASINAEALLPLLELQGDAPVSQHWWWRWPGAHSAAPHPQCLACCWPKQP